MRAIDLDWLLLAMGILAIDYILVGKMARCVRRDQAELRRRWPRHVALTRKKVCGSAANRDEGHQRTSFVLSIVTTGKHQDGFSHRRIGQHFVRLLGLLSNCGNGGGAY